MQIAQQVLAGQTIYVVQGKRGGNKIDVDLLVSLLDAVDRTTTHDVLVGSTKPWRGQAVVSEVAARADLAGAFPVTHHAFVYDNKEQTVNRREIDVLGFEGPQAVVGSGLCFSSLLR